MSLTTEPNINTFTDRIAQMLQNSAILFPNSIGGDGTKTDLVKQVIKDDIPVAQDVPDGEGPPHIFIRDAPNPIVSDKRAGTDTRDIKGPREIELEIWAVCVVNEPEYNLSENALHDITAAVREILGKNKRMLDTSGLNPLSSDLSYFVTPFTLLETEEKTAMAKTVVIRPKVGINLRG